MKSHDLARVLLAAPDLPVELNVYGHSYSSLNHKGSHGPLKVALHNNNYGVPHVVIASGTFKEDGEVVHEDVRE